MDLVSAYKIAASATFAMMTSLWICSLPIKDASIVDRFWGAGFVLIAWVLHLTVPSAEHNVTRAVVLALVTIWGLRLSLYIHVRNRGHGEDYRYAEMRRHHGSRFWWYSFLSVFSLQGILMLLVSAPIILVMSNPEVSKLTHFGVAGFLVWIVGFVFEAGGDWQLTQFKKNPANKGQLLRDGLWSVTRHPNYFGDALQWWGLGIFAIPYGTFGIVVLAGPLLMTLFIRKVSGVDLLEKSLANRKPGYEDYVRSTPPFLPSLKFWLGLTILCVIGILVFQYLSVH